MFRIVQMLLRWTLDSFSFFLERGKNAFATKLPNEQSLGFGANSRGMLLHQDICDWQFPFDHVYREHIHHYSEFVVLFHSVLSKWKLWISFIPGGFPSITSICSMFVTFYLHGLRPGSAKRQGLLAPRAKLRTPTHTHAHTHTCVETYTDTYTDTYRYTCATQTETRAYLQIDTHTHTPGQTRTFRCTTYAYTYTCACTDAYTHRRRHTTWFGELVLSFLCFSSGIVHRLKKEWKASASH